MAWNKVAKPLKPFLVWGGVNWVKDHEGYYRCKARGPMRGKRLHVEVYKSVHGEIPKGHHIDHVDSNKDNSLDPANLQALPADIHAHKSNRRKRELARAAQEEAGQTKIDAEPWDVDPIRGGQNVNEEQQAKEEK